MILDGTVIDSMVVGGPAYNTGQLDRGDIILRINHEPVAEDNLHALLVGTDSPGSTVTISVRKAERPAGQADVRDVILTRMDTETIADRCRLYELCAAIKVPIAAPATGGFQGCRGTEALECE
jgi:C-terminal processing protease CtpA/Prc